MELYEILRQKKDRNGKPEELLILFSSPAPGKITLFVTEHVNEEAHRKLAHMVLENVEKYERVHFFVENDPEDREFLEDVFLRNEYSLEKIIRKCWRELDAAMVSLEGLYEFFKVIRESGKADKIEFIYYDVLQSKTQFNNEDAGRRELYMAKTIAENVSEKYPNIVLIHPSHGSNVGELLKEWEYEVEFCCVDESWFGRDYAEDKMKYIRKYLKEENIEIPKKKKI